MSKEYIFKYSGSKESFLTVLDSFHSNNSRIYYLDNYIIEVRDDEIYFGVERAGHSGGNWFVSKFIEENNQIIFRGTIQYIGPENSRTKIQKAFDKIVAILLWILLFPLYIVFYFISQIIRLIGKIRKRPLLETTEEKLLNLMEKRLNCQRVLSEPNE